MTITWSCGRFENWDGYLTVLVFIYNQFSGDALKDFFTKAVRVVHKLSMKKNVFKNVQFSHTHTHSHNNKRKF